MMKAIPSHRDNYAKIVLGIIIQFYQQCSDRVQRLTMMDVPDESAPQPVLPLVWAQNADLALCLSKMKESVVRCLHFLLSFEVIVIKLFIRVAVPAC